jgi:hypothetical protein
MLKNVRNINARRARHEKVIRESMKLVKFLRTSPELPFNGDKPVMPPH